MEWFSDRELEESCDRFIAQPDNAEGALCMAFIQGFLSGSDTIAASKTGDRAAAPAGSETFTERAARTRLGTLRMKQLRTTNQADYCLDDTTSAIEVIENVAAYLREHREAWELTNAEVVREALMHYYPCTP